MEDLAQVKNFKIKDELLGQEHNNGGYIDDTPEKIKNETMDDVFENTLNDEMEDKLIEPLDQELCIEEVIDNEITEPRFEGGNMEASSVVSKYFTIPGSSQMF